MRSEQAGHDEPPARRARVSAIAALDEDGVIGGASGGVPWRIPEDSRRFRAKVAGHPLVMGRVTFEEFETPPQDTFNIVVTRDEKYRAPAGVLVAHTIGEALMYAHEDDDEEIFIGGGAALYRGALEFCDRLYLTIVHGHFEGSVRFPDHSRFTRVLERSSHEADGYKYDFVTLER